MRYRWLLILLILIVSKSADAQENQCEVADSLSYPIDTNTFQMVQDYGIASPRHQGRYHTGEDWYGGDRASLGQPVLAIGNGRVTYSAPNGWGRDGGVVIIEHRLPDGTTIYSQYGHIAESENIPFPRRLTCVEAGDLIGVIGDSRPAPHLHFEIRVGSPDNPGPGYSRDNLAEQGWRPPMKTVTNLQARLHPAYLWHVMTDDLIDAPPLVLTTNEMLLLDGSLLRRATNDGRLLYRVPTAYPAVSINGFEASPLVVYADGTLGRVDFDGNPGEEWSLDFRPDMPPFFLPGAEGVDGSPLFHTADNELAALTDDWRNFRWWVEDVPPYQHVYVGNALIALEFEHELWLLSHDGEIVDRAMIKHGADFATHRDGSLIVYTAGGLWQVDESGEWTEFIADVPPGGAAGAVAITDDGRIYLTDGESIYAYSRIRELAWQAQLPLPVTGRVTMTHYDEVLLITSNHGDIVAAGDSGGICGFTRIYGDDDSRQWHQVGADGTLRVAVHDQIIGLDWERFTTGC